MGKTVSINWRPKNLEDDIIKLTPLSETDFENLFEVAADPLIWEQHPSSNRYKREVFQLFFDEAILNNSAFLIIEKTSNKIIGSTRFYNYSSENSSVSIGYTFLARQFWGGQYNKSTKKLLLDYAFKQVDKVCFHIGANNIRSQLAIHKIGAIKINSVDFENEGKMLPHFEYLIKKQDWGNKI